ncbi:MAG: RNA polymerase sigma factor [Oscillospiraceae bacterium]|nr:RNA polymerase sigma factor [Oscillospiraceae bacterium]
MGDRLTELFMRLRGGDDSVFAEIYGEVKKPVYIIIYRIVGNHETAEEIMQELFLKLYKAPPEEMTNPKGWIFTCARNLAIDAVRKRRPDTSEEEPHTSGEAERITDKIDIERAIAGLSCGEREVLSLYVNAGLTFEEISQITGASRSAVYRTYRRALKALRKQL